MIDEISPARIPWRIPVGLTEAERDEALAARRAKNDAEFQAATARARREEERTPRGTYTKNDFTPNGDEHGYWKHRDTGPGRELDFDDLDQETSIEWYVRWLHDQGVDIC